MFNVKMKNHCSKYALTFFILLILNSCDPIVGYEYHLRNASDSALIIKFKANRNVGDTICVLKILKHSDTLIYKTEIWGSNPHDENNRFLKLFDFITAARLDGKPVNKDIRNRAYWNYKNKIVHFGLIKTGTNIYTLVLTNDDIK